MLERASSVRSLPCILLETEGHGWNLDLTKGSGYGPVLAISLSLNNDIANATGVWESRLAREP